MILSMHHDSPLRGLYILLDVHVLCPVSFFFRPRICSKRGGEGEKERGLSLVSKIKMQLLVCTVNGPPHVLMVYHVLKTELFAVCSA